MVQLVVLGYNLLTKKFKILNRTSITKTATGDTNVQTLALNSIVDLDEKFKCKFVYVDKGYGSTQSEILQKYFFKKSELHKFKTVDFGSNYSRKNILTGEEESKRLKGMLVYFLQKRFEYREIEISQNEETGATGLVMQLDHYIVDHYDSKDNPVFAAGLRAGDHILDALMIANFAFVENFEHVLSFNDMISVAEKAEINEDLDNFVNNVYGVASNENTMSKTKASFMNIYNDNDLYYNSIEPSGNKAISEAPSGKMFGRNRNTLNRTKIF